LSIHFVKNQRTSWKLVLHQSIRTIIASALMAMLVITAILCSGPAASAGINTWTGNGLAGAQVDQAGIKAPVTVNINRVNGFAGNVTVTPLPPGNGIKPKPSGPFPTTDSSVTFKLKIGAGVPAGTYLLVISGQDDSSRQRSTTLTLRVQ
jgi:hypothetical protein